MITIFTKEKLTPGKAHSLRKRLGISLFASALIPIILIGWSSYSTITREARSRVEQTIQSGLKHTRLSVENLLDNLDSISKQFAYSEEMASKLSSYIEIDNMFQKYSLKKEIRRQINLIYNTNLNIGTILYLDGNNKVLVASDTIVGNFAYAAAPLIYENDTVRYYGPHPSADRNAAGYVFSVIRKVDDFWADNCYVYIETKARVTVQILAAGQSTERVSYILAGDDGKAVWSGAGAAAAGEKIDMRFDGGAVEKDGLYYFSESSWRGWSLLRVIRAEDYHSLLRAWLVRFAASSAFVVVISVLLAIMGWRMIYKPMGVIHKEISLLSDNPYNSERKKTNIIEFDQLLSKFYEMKQNILSLLNEVKAKERTKRMLEVEKLLYQINPHFLHNTLNAAQLLAMQNEQKEISKIIVLLTKLLHYNMGKEGTFVTIRDEVDALETYVELQKIRFDYLFSLQLEIEEETQEALIPRFILQPIVENSLYHGMKNMREQGVIRIRVHREGHNLKIIVADNGEGMDARTLKQYLEDDECKRVGLGIGIHYVSKIIGVNYESDGSFDIQSKTGETSFIITIPFTAK